MIPFNFSYDSQDSSSRIDVMKKLVISGLKESHKRILEEILISPLPQKVVKGEKSFKLSTSLRLIHENIDNIDHFKNLLNDELAYHHSPLISDVSESNLNDVKSPEFNDEKQAEEGYSLNISNDDAIIIAKTEKGMFYGIQTLMQLLYSNDEGTYLPGITIIDYPNFKIRAIADDISRGQVPTVENVKKFIRILSKFKINFFFMGYECDIFYYEKHPKIGIGRDPLTKDEIKEIDEYAKKYFMELVPLVTTTGHMDNILLVPGYEDMGEFPGAQCFDISQDKVRHFTKDILDEICTNFSSDYVHITCDELFDFGKYKSRDYLTKKGKEKALVEHYEFMFDILRKKGKKHVLMYHDTVLKYKKVREKLPNDIIIFFWEYFLHMNFRHIKKLQKAGYQVIVSPTVFSWTRNFPDIERSIYNIVGLTKYGYERNVLGTGVSSWGDFGNESFRDNRLYGFALSGAISWNTPSFEINHFEKAFIRIFLGSMDGRIIKIFHSIALVNKLISGLVANLMAVPIFYALFWRHPFPSRRLKINKKNLLKMMREMELDLKRIEDVRPFVTKNQDYLDYIVMAAKIGKYYAKKNLHALKITELLKASQMRDKDKKEAIDSINVLRKDLKEIREKYQELWLRCAKPDGLKRLLPFYNYHDFLLVKKIEEIEANIGWQNPFLESEWIGYPEKKIHQEFRYFRKKFSLPSRKIKKAFLQGISNHYMKIYLNETELGEVYSRFSLAVRPIDQRVKVFDITEKLKENNVIAVEGAYFANYVTAVNIYVEIHYENGEKETIKSDISWKTNKAGDSDWKKLDFDDSPWLQARSHGAPPKFNGEITRPYLVDNWPSQTHYMFGGRGFFRIFMPSFLMPILNRFLKSIGA